ncbi:serine protease inhibitor 88Ea isoform X2 [Copidosoma floridanum]|uniref:serine protease inhibitor 88Ea isoform X2 n=1 Tax=Copidosoma floridanum TaxID=29053 RepID=UPI000C6FACFB|nr:serine protease inhibitor 88Ea isoform X2 [Copidosoma floridanum]
MLAAFLILVSLVKSSHSQCLTGNDNPKVMANDTRTQLSGARLNFGLASLRHLADIEPEENVFFSPHSLYEALGLAYFGARGHTEASLKMALQVPDDLSKLDVARFYAFEKSEELLRKKESGSDYEYQVANRLFLSGEKKMRECMFDFFGDELVRTNFKSNPMAAREAINQWVSNVTRNNIRDFLPANAIDESTDAVIANAVYFKGLWKSRFDPKMTKRDVFHLGDNTMTTTLFMRKKGLYNHLSSEELGVHILQLPYKGHGISMYILLPPFVTTSSQARSADKPKLDAIQQLLQRISDPSSQNAQELRDILDNGMQSRDVELTIPKFSMERELPTKELLDAMSVHGVLDPSANYTGFTKDGEKGIQLDSALHKAKIELTEGGTTAAAATALFTFRSSRPTEPAIFNANHPFVYFIYDRSTQAMLFAGIFRKPNKK